MPVGPDKKLSLLLSGGVDNRTADELTAPVVVQGSAPVLKRCTNARLGVVAGGVVRSPLFNATQNYGAGVRAAAMVSAAAGKRTLVLTTPELGVRHRVLADAGRTTMGGASTIYDEGSASSLQQACLPAQVVDSDGLGPGKSTTQFAATHNALSLNVWHAYISSSPSGDRVMVTASTSAGVALSAPQEAASLTTGARRWIGVTSHGANGDRVWYVNNAAAVCYRTVTASSNLISVGAEAVVVTPGSNATGLDVCRGDDTFAYLAHSRAGTAADGTIRKVNVTTGATAASVDITNALQGGGECSVYAGALNSAARVAVGFASVTSGNAVARIYDTALALQSTTPSQACVGRVTVAFYQEGASFGVGLGTETHATSLLVQMTVYNAAGGFVDTGAFPWTALNGHAASWVVDATHQYPILPLVPRFGTTLEAPGEANFVDDPSVDIAWLSAPIGNSYAMIARVGVVRGTTSPVDVVYTGTLASKSLIAVGDDLHVTYRTLTDYGGSGASTARNGRRAVIRLGSSNRLPSTHDRDGLGFLAGALPLQWDGRRVVELGAPLHAPHITVTKTVGGTVLTAGTYSLMGVYYWSDAAGLLHRSRPSAVQTVTMNGATDSLTVAITTQYSIHHRLFEARVYCTEPNGKTFHLMGADQPPGSPYTTVYAVNGQQVTAARAQIYSGGGLGEEVTPQPPPPAWDIYVIGPRCWIVDAEIRSRAVHSKLRIAGIGFEFSPALEVIVPSGAGDLMAVREWRGTVILLAERAVYQVSGDGPNNTLGGGGAYSPPFKISDIGCSNTASVVVCPSGIMWQVGERFALLGDAGVSYVPDFLCTHDVSAAVALTKYGEVLFFSATVSEVRVYHYETGRWTTWDTLTLAGETVQAAQLMPHDPDTLVTYNETTGNLRRVEAASVSAAGSMLFETDWLLLAGNFHDSVLLRDVVFDGRLSGPQAGLHGIQIDLMLDFASAPSTSRSWTFAQLDAIDVNGYYSVRLEPQLDGCRAVKVRVTDTLAASYGCSPRSLTIIFALDGVLREEVFVVGSRQ